ncbi:hypothetical protein SLEP1_g9646 [Rubroshorea leprosula]|uniref:Leucine-rich repeat-containing N-terminal plant-type domain-containing protein n=1 Tax=Rubroshorea leprosula TaxID=152421 RepID=A0AAV5IB97_9ROSI|nr:hypothetical protein SLEP1_g9646 [Rubroshorea leprosula]
MMAALNFPFLAIVSLFLVIPICLNHLALGFQTPLATALPPQNETDKLALLAFKDKILEDPFGVMSSWNESLHFCNWRGVSCSHRHKGRVTNLNLTGQKLVGLISPHIGNLSFIRQINLGHNYFKGEIPQEIGQLFRLRFLSLSFNVLQGKIPSNLAFCSRLQDVYFSENSLIGEIPTELRNLSKSVRRICFFGNHLIGSIPQWLGNASSLEILALKSNNIHGSIPVELVRPPKLDILLLSTNNLSGRVPVSFFNSSSLTVLSLAVNQLQELPTSLQNASLLRTFAVTANNLGGVIPSNLGGLRNLTSFGVSGNWLESKDEGLGILTSLANCTNLRILDLGFNRLKGKIPEGIGNLIGLTYLQLDTNYLRGEIPSSIVKLEKLSILALGTIPITLGNCSQLLDLYLGKNYLIGDLTKTALELIFIHNPFFEREFFYRTIALRGAAFQVAAGHNNLATERKTLREIVKTKSKERDTNFSSLLEKLMKELWEELTKEHLKLGAKIKRMEEDVKAVEEDRSVLRKQSREISQTKDEAKKCILNFQKQQNDMITEKIMLSS